MSSDSLTNLGKLDLGLRGALSAFEEDAAAPSDDGIRVSLGFKPYGVEFHEAAIDAALNSGAAVHHRDCDGQGTHVAGIAAGGRVFPEVG